MPRHSGPTCKRCNEVGTRRGRSPWGMAPFAKLKSTSWSIALTLSHPACIELSRPGRQEDLLGIALPLPCEKVRWDKWLCLWNRTTQHPRLAAQTLNADEKRVLDSIVRQKQHFCKVSRKKKAKGLEKTKSAAVTSSLPRQNSAVIPRACLQQSTRSSLSCT